MSALINFVNAAASYYGVPLDQLTHGSGIATETGDLEVVLRVKVNDADLVAIAKRMERMALERAVDERQAVPKAPPTDEELRSVYNALTLAERSSFGSFARFKANAMAGVEAMGMVPKVELPAHVYLSPQEATEQQKAMAVGRDGRGWFAVDPDDLTEQQRNERGMK